MKRMIDRLAIALATSISCVAASAAPLPAICQAADDVAGVVTPLPHVRAALQPGSTFDVLAVGSASIFGPEATSAPKAQIMTAGASATAFPQQMAKALEAAVPSVKVNVTVQGGRGLSAADQLRLLQDALQHGKFSLVIWQTGTVEAVRNMPPSEFAQTLAEGADLTEQSGADLVLIDPQYSRFLQTNSNLEPYEQAFQQLSSLPGVVLFHRFDLMRFWVNEGSIDLERTPGPGRKKAAEQLHACLGNHLARLILNGARF